MGNQEGGVGAAVEGTNAKRPFNPIRFKSQRKGQMRAEIKACKRRRAPPDKVQVCQGGETRLVSLRTWGIRRSEALKKTRGEREKGAGTACYTA